MKERGVWALGTVHYGTVKYMGKVKVDRGYLVKFV